MKINSIMLNLLTHLCHNFHILGLLIDKNAKIYNNSKIISVFQPILTKLNNPYMEINSEIITIVKRNNDIIKSNLKACMPYIPESSQNS